MPARARGRATLGLMYVQLCYSACLLLHTTVPPLLCSRGAGWALGGLLRVDVHVLRVSQQTDALLLLSLFRHLKKPNRKPTLVQDGSHLSDWRPLPPTGNRSLAIDSPHRSVHSKRLTEATAKPQLQIHLLTNAEYKQLIAKLGRTKFQRSSKASES